jgi:hypothetical protein
VQIDVERFVSDAHRTTSQLDRFSVFAPNEFVMLESLQRGFRRVLRRAEEDSVDSAPSARPLRSMHTGQNSIAPENSFPQLEQVRWGSVFIDLTALQPQLSGNQRRAPSSGAKSAFTAPGKLLSRSTSNAGEPLPSPCR